MNTSPEYDRAMDAAMSMIEGKWKSVILCRLARAGIPMRYGQLMNEIGGISPRIFTLQLREMENDNLIVREVRSESPKCIVYSLSEKGRTLIPVLAQLADWSLRNLSPDITVFGRPQISDDEKVKA